MKAFQFPLQRVLEWRETRMQMEERNLKMLRARLSEVESRLLALIQSAEAEAQSVCRERIVSGNRLAALAAFRVGSKKAVAAAQLERSECMRVVTEQEKRFLEARRNVKLLEKLKERRKSEWQIGFDKELEAIAAECYLAKRTAEPS